MQEPADTGLVRNDPPAILRRRVPHGRKKELLDNLEKPARREGTPRLFSAFPQGRWRANFSWGRRKGPE